MKSGTRRSRSPLRLGRLIEHLRRIPNRRDIQSPGCPHREYGGRIGVTQDMESQKSPLAPRWPSMRPQSQSGHFCG